MLAVKSIRESLNGHRERAGNPAAGDQAFIDEMRESLGLAVRHDSSGALMESVDEYGRPRIARNALKPSQFNLTALAEAILGIEVVRSWDPRQNRSGSASSLTEAGPGIDPSALGPITLYKAAVGTVIAAQILESYQTPQLIGDRLVRVMPTGNDGERILGTHGYNVNLGEQERKPNQPHPRGSVGGRYVDVPTLKERALAVDVTQEAVFFDRTSEILTRAEGVGETLGIGRERVILRLVTGLAGDYTEDGTTYATFLATGYYVNKHVNPVTADYVAMDKLGNLMYDMTDPHTEDSIVVYDGDMTILTDRAKVAMWHTALNSTETREETNGNARTTLSTPPRAPEASSQPTVLHSPRLRKLLKGAGLPDATVEGRWWGGDPQKAFRWMENWPLRVDRADSGEYVMKDRGLIASYFANYRGDGVVYNPRYWFENDPS